MNNSDASAREEGRPEPEDLLTRYHLHDNDRSSLAPAVTFHDTDFGTPGKNHHKPIDKA
jgi:hypothetical protein